MTPSRTDTPPPSSTPKARTSEPGWGSAAAIGAGVAPRDACREGASVAQGHLSFGDIGECLLGSDNDVFAPERCRAHPMPRHDDAGDQRLSEPRALDQCFGQTA